MSDRNDHDPEKVLSPEEATVIFETSGPHKDSAGGIGVPVNRGCLRLRSRSQRQERLRCADISSWPTRPLAATN
jgi:hypothetical protein